MIKYYHIIFIVPIFLFLIGCGNIDQTVPSSGPAPEKKTVIATQNLDVLAKSYPHLLDKVFSAAVLPASVLRAISANDRVALTSLERFGQSPASVQTVIDRGLTKVLLNNATQVVERNEFALNPLVNENGRQGSQNISAASKLLGYRVLECGVIPIHLPGTDRITRVANLELELRVIDCSTSRILCVEILTAQAQDTVTDRENDFLTTLAYQYYPYTLPLVSGQKSGDSRAINGIWDNGDGQAQRSESGLELTFDRSSKAKSVEIRDAENKLVRKIEVPAVMFNVKTFHYTWDKKDELGQQVTNGQYVVVDASNGKQLQTVTIE